MKFPNFSDLDEEQLRIYGHAPSDGAILVIGAPGTGKTVMAFHRAQKLAGIGQSPSVIMYNKVLQKYSGSRGGVAKDVPVMTMHQWVFRWWRGGGMGKWAPRDQEDRWSFDWEEIQARIFALDESDRRIARLNWGHLIIDEGQDFPESMYFALGRLMKHFKKCGQEAQVTVFADDNQRLEADKNSTVKNIARNLGIQRSTDRIFVLEKNYRNTKPVAQFARYFQVGKESGATSLPDRPGDLPTVAMFPEEHELFDFIGRKAKLAGGKQVGVIVHGSKRDVRSTYNKLKNRLPENFGIQRYYNDRELDLAEALDFDAQNMVTVVNEKSAKGLEFDLVFYVGLERVDIDGSGALNERMVAYVMSSRAREELVVLFSGIKADSRVPDGLSLMPKVDLDICRFDAFGELKDAAGDVLKKIQWREPDPDAPFWSEAA